ncbi:MAG TPA: hypothetical protein VFW41_12130 [Gaiellaceae bacterium]|nr:hypothetical protein [Gaiellaceae bacterium]
MNKEIRRLAESYAVADDLDLVSECAAEDCFAPMSVSRVEYETVRAFPTRFLVRRDHVGADERILEHGEHYVIVEKTDAQVEQAV